ncbi:Uncharacterized protein FWK35_00035454 [Aphis craccivora]|uniref:Uncharacterized protein n=1 Tax=Aphis craccivora TaxID=307492 RepID=A0A6G0VN73_APHCR|nr:Uncharacterized protein FWK35_00035454 [Aphis craccivora]
MGVATSPVMRRYQRATKRKLFTNKNNEPNTKISINNDLIIEDIENEDMPIDTEHMFKKLIYWPDRECLRTYMPISFFNAFGNSVAVIIDCFEIGIEKPSNLKARA